MHSDPGKSVVAVPPLARNADLTLNIKANGALIRHLEAGGVSTLMYGGNANFYHLGVSDYPRVLDMLLELAAPTSWIIPSAGPDFGKLMDQARFLRERPFPTAMVLPASGFSTDAGTADGISRFADAFGRPVILYLKSESYLSVASVARLHDKGVVAAIKYAIVRDDPGRDSYLSQLVTAVDRSRIISGIGERPAIQHWRQFGLRGFTSGSVSIAPRLSSALLAALKAEDHTEAERLRELFLPFENERDAINPTRVLHDGVTLAGIADMGPILPLLSNLDNIERARVAPVARQLQMFDAALAKAA
ncbi:dihydrodipicolinate synthase family protein [Nordella sp. HKS 07]|uniref:dihydrodipicolinate synthase family protein n=1 Tax=Nordella sp. HKS 07 TaxID=2712222 RepID=UPI0013E15F02|nr:dihydrodipicolinate synthase family protein [Nordella sp. HKS 07]QIG47405.1 dihydrodipicolinate synthase family protein [Nordella sp. HKS 07]